MGDFLSLEISRDWLPVIHVRSVPGERIPFRVVMDGNQRLVEVVNENQKGLVVTVEMENIAQLVRTSEKGVSVTVSGPKAEIEKLRRQVDANWFPERNKWRVGQKVSRDNIKEGDIILDEDRGVGVVLRDDTIAFVLVLFRRRGKIIWSHYLDPGGVLTGSSDGATEIADNAAFFRKYNKALREINE